MTKPGLKKPRGKPFEKGDDPRRAQLVPGGRTHAFTREMKDCLKTAAENVGNRLVAIANAKLPKRPTAALPKELIALMRREPEGMISYFEWLAEQRPELFVVLMGRALPTIMQHEGGDGGVELVYRTPEEIEEAIRAQNMPMLQRVFKLPPRIDLKDPPVIDVTPAIAERDKQ
jgi:hypothetical protein